MGYVVVGELEKLNQQVFNNGTIEGYNQAHIDIFNTVSLCQQFPVQVGNISYNLFAV